MTVLFIPSRNVVSFQHNGLSREVTPNVAKALVASLGFGDCESLINEAIQNPSIPYTAENISRAKGVNRRKYSTVCN